MHARTIAAKILAQVIQKQSSLTTALLENLPENADRALIQEIAFGVIRYYFFLQKILDKLLQKPLKAKDADISIALLIGLYQSIFLRIPDHAAVNETVKIAKELKKRWAEKLINGVLRNFLRQKDLLLKEFSETEIAEISHPLWFVRQIKKSWPQAWQKILIANNQHPPLTLRINSRQISRAKYLALLEQNNIEAQICKFSENALSFTQAMTVEKIPGFKEGMVSVQDQAAQIAADLLDLKPEQRVLDACAAPGGKSAHILEKEPKIAELIAIDSDAERTKKIASNLTRLNLHAKIIITEAEKTREWWNGQLFDRILLDVPCSATGVIRRHPDIKLLRRETDIFTLTQMQSILLENLWPLLKPAGLLLYSTCSVLPDENENIVQQFLSKTADAKEKLISADWGCKRSTGRQILPGEENMDGFYYCLIEKIKS